MADLFLDNFTGTEALSVHTSDSGHTYVSAGGSATPDKITLSGGLAGTFAPSHYGGGKATVAVPASIVAEFEGVIGAFASTAYLNMTLVFDGTFPTVQIDNTTIYFTFGGAGNPTKSRPYVSGTHTFRFEASPDKQEWFFDNVSVGTTAVAPQSVVGNGFGFSMDNSSNSNSNNFRASFLRMAVPAPPPPFWTQHTNASEGTR